MARLRGSGLGAGMALGTAAVVRQRSGFPMLPTVPTHIAGALARRKDHDKPDIILVADDYLTALAMVHAISWGRVVGIAAERAEPNAVASPLPAVVHVPGLMSVVEEHQLMLVDAERGLVTMDPDGVAVAQFQAEHDHLIPRRRVHLGEAHLPAQTLDGHTIQVVAWLEESADLALALETGADALHATTGSALLPDADDEETVRENLLQFVKEAAGKPLILLDDYTLPMTATLEAAGSGELTLAVPPRPDLNGLGLAELLDEAQGAVEECLENGAPFAMPLLAADVTTACDAWKPEEGKTRVEALATRGAARLLFGLAPADLEARLRNLDSILSASSAYLLPAFVHLEAVTGEEAMLRPAVEALIGMGVSGLIVAPEQIARTKAWIRELNASERREEISERLTGAEAVGE